MEKKKYFVICIIVIIVLILIIFVYNGIKGNKDCINDEDCAPFGISSCNCGCYNKEHFPWWEIGDCRCLAPKECVCEYNTCIPAPLEE